MSNIEINEEDDNNILYNNSLCDIGDIFRTDNFEIDDTLIVLIKIIQQNK